MSVMHHNVHNRMCHYYYKGKKIKLKKWRRKKIKSKVNVSSQSFTPFEKIKINTSLFLYLIFIKKNVFTKKKNEYLSIHFRVKSNNVAKQSNRFNCFRIITVCHIFCFLSQWGKTHQTHKITEKRKAVTFEKVDQRRSEV